MLKKSLGFITLPGLMKVRTLSWELKIRLEMRNGWSLSLVLYEKKIGSKILICFIL